MSEFEARAAAEEALTTAMPALQPAPVSGWQRAAEVTGLVALGLLIAVGALPW